MWAIDSNVGNSHIHLASNRHMFHNLLQSFLHACDREHVLGMQKMGVKRATWHEIISFICGTRSFISYSLDLSQLLCSSKVEEESLENLSRQYRIMTLYT